MAELYKIGTGSNSTEDVLRRVQIFAGLDERELRALAARAVRKKYDAGQLIFSEGEPCAGLYVVANGRIRIFKTSASGREQVLSVEGPGSSVAELPVFDGGAYPASTSALDECETIFVSRRDFQALCMEHPEVSLKVLPRPRLEETRRLELPAVEAVAAFNRWAALPLPLSAAAWSQGSAWVRLSGAPAAVRAAHEQIAGDSVPASVADRFWSDLRHCQLPLFTADNL